MADARSFTGGCHCGNVEMMFETRRAPEELAVRACACSFCRRHAARTVTDPEGRARIVVRDPAKLSRYRFGLRTADFLVCRECGVYTAALYAEGGAAYVTLNINAFDASDAFTEEPVVVDYDGEGEAERRARRKAKWTPVELVESGSAATTKETEAP
jgi:hypothetical protein